MHGDKRLKNAPSDPGREADKWLPKWSGVNDEQEVTVNHRTTHHTQQPTQWQGMAWHSVDSVLSFAVALTSDCTCSKF